jgi:hypothetical protein
MKNSIHRKSVIEDVSALYRIVSLLVFVCPQLKRRKNRRILFSTYDSCSLKFIRIQLKTVRLHRVIRIRILTVH